MSTSLSLFTSAQDFPPCKSWDWKQSLLIEDDGGFSWDKHCAMTIKAAYDDAATLVRRWGAPLEEVAPHLQLVHEAVNQLRAQVEAAPLTDYGQSMDMSVYTPYIPALERASDEVCAAMINAFI